MAQEQGFLDDPVLVVADGKSAVAGRCFQSERFEELRGVFGRGAGEARGFNKSKAHIGNGADRA
ncbi:MAG: hypothetical protein O3A51_07660, partial [Verrucomicrobia bacterium]|nr:hypothetical protein [Verrucomicrobiota bacterium]